MSAFDKRLKYIIIDDILIEILFNLNVRQLLRLERVSKQFENCVYYPLKRQKVLFIGNVKHFIFYSLKNKEIISKGNITQVFIKNSRYLTKECVLIGNQIKYRLQSLLEKFSHIKSLYLNDRIINA
jgi:hypothetical protein